MNPQFQDPNKRKALKKALHKVDPVGFSYSEQLDQTEHLEEIKDNTSKIAQNTENLKEPMDKVFTAGDFIDGFLKHIKGEKGDKGETGEQGPKGDPGIDGKDGIDGIDGKDGVDGKDGKEGPVGPPGASIRGERGKDGVDGKDGKDGKDAKPEDVVEYLKNAPEDKKLDISHLKNFQSLLPKKGSGYKLTDQRWHGGGSNEAIISFIIDGGGSAITTGIVGDLAIQFNCEIKEVELLADTTGSIVIDMWMADYASYPPTVVNTITGTTPPTITNDIKSKDVTLSGWTRNLTLGDTLRYNVNSASTITRCLISLKVVKK